MSVDSKVLEKIFQRLETLESKVSQLEKKLKPAESSTANATAVSAISDFEGLSGGISKVIKEGFLNEPKLVSEINSELNRLGYYYPITSVNKVLYIDFMKRLNLLTRIGKRREWRYVIRK